MYPNLAQSGVLYVRHIRNKNTKIGRFRKPILCPKRPNVSLLKYVPGGYRLLKSMISILLNSP